MRCREQHPSSPFGLQETGRSLPSLPFWHKPSSFETIETHNTKEPQVITILPFRPCPTSIQVRDPRTLATTTVDRPAGGSPEEPPHPRSTSTFRVATRTTARSETKHLAKLNQDFLNLPAQILNAADRPGRLHPAGARKSSCFPPAALRRQSRVGARPCRSCKRKWIIRNNRSPSLRRSSSM